MGGGSCEGVVAGSRASGTGLEGGKGRRKSWVRICDEKGGEVKLVLWGRVGGGLRSGSRDLAQKRGRLMSTAGHSKGRIGRH